MEARLNAYKAAPDLMECLSKLNDTVHAAGLEPALMELVKTRASQINGCAYCIYTHTREARAEGESEQRLYLLDAWRESSFYSPRERAALEWTEALTLISNGHATDASYSQARNEFTDRELVILTLLVTTINAYNRIAIGFRSQHPIRPSASAQRIEQQPS